MNTTMRRHLRFSAISFSLCCAVCWAACQPVSVPVTNLEPAEKTEIARHLLDEMPAPEYPVHAIFDGKIELLGYDLEPSDEIAAGAELTITWYWRVLAPLDDLWEIFVHLDGFPPDMEGGHRQNMDHQAIDGLFPTIYWDEGQIIRDVQTARLDAVFGATDVVLHVGFWRRSSATRMEISNPGTGEIRMEIGPLRVNGRAIFRRNEGPRLRLGTLRGLEPAARRESPEPRHADGVLVDPAVVGQDIANDGNNDRTGSSDGVPRNRQPGSVHALEGTQFRLPEPVVPHHVLDLQEHDSFGEREEN